MKFCTNVFYITLTVTVTCIPLMGGIMQYFWDNFLYIAQGLEKLKHFFDILHECLNITVVVTKLRKCLAFLCFEHSGCF